MALGERSRSSSSGPRSRAIGEYGAHTLGRCSLTAAVVAIGAFTGAFTGCSELTAPGQNTPAFAQFCRWYYEQILAYSRNAINRICKATDERFRPTRAASGVTAVASLRIAGVAPKGKVAGGKLPDWNADLYPDSAARTRRNSALNFDLTVSALVFNNNLEAAAESFQTAKVTIWTVDSRGNATKLATKSGAYDPEEAGVVVLFEGIKPPKNHYRVRLETDRGSVNGGRVVYIAAVTQAGGIARIARIELRRLLSAPRPPTDGLDEQRWRK